MDQPINNPFPKDKFEHLLYHKNWIDTVQWHFEDIIRDPQIDPVAALVLKRKIDASNQVRTDMVEYIYQDLVSCHADADIIHKSLTFSL